MGFGIEGEAIARTPHRLNRSELVFWVELFSQSTHKYFNYITVAIKVLIVNMLRYG